MRRIAMNVVAIACVALLSAACSASKAPPAGTASPETELRAELDDLTKRLTEMTNALEQAQRERGELTASKNELAAKVEQLEREKQDEIEALQSKNQEQANASRNRIRGLSAEIATLKKEIEEKDVQSAEKDAEIAQLKQSIDTHRTQITSLEKENAALSEELTASKKSRTTITAILGAFLAVSAVMAVAGFAKARKRGGKALAREDRANQKVGSR